MRNIKGLISAIIQSAAEDYITMKNENTEFISDRPGEKVFLKDVVAFFNSKWCTQLLYTYGCEITGSDFLKKIEKERRRCAVGIS